MVRFEISSDLNPSILSRPTKKAEMIVAIQALKDTRPFVPALTESLNQRTRAEGAKIIYPGPYARYLYYGKVMEGPLHGPKHETERDLVFTQAVHPQAQAFWFEVSKAQNISKWVRVADKAVKHGI